MESGSVTAKKRQRTSFRCRLTTENFLEIVCVSAEKEKSDSYPDCPHRTCWKDTSTPTYHLMYSTVRAVSWSKKGLCWARGEMAPRLPCLNTWPRFSMKPCWRKEVTGGGYQFLFQFAFTFVINTMTKSLPLLYHSPPVREAGQELEQMPQKSAAYWLVYLDLLSRFYNPGSPT